MAEAKESSGRGESSCQLPSHSCSCDSPNPSSCVPTSPCRRGVCHRGGPAPQTPGCHRESFLNATSRHPEVRCCPPRAWHAWGAGLAFTLPSVLRNLQGFHHCPEPGGQEGTWPGTSEQNSWQGTERGKKGERQVLEAVVE